LAATWAEKLEWMMRKSFHFCQYRIEQNYFSAVLAVLSGRQKTSLKDFSLLTKLTTFWPNGAWG
jgi:hypothetical protein